MPNINKNIIKQAGAAVANATNKAAGLSASTPEPGAIISAIQLVNGGRSIGPDSLAHFTESVRNKLLSLLVTMEPIQDFNGYGHPWPAGGGKNLLPLIDGTYNVGSTGVAAVVADGSITIAGATTASGGRTTRLSDYFILPAGTYIVSPLVSSPYIRGYINKRAGNTAVGYTTGNPFTLTEDTEVYYGVALEAGKNYDATIYPQVESGSTITDWQPYSNICPISGRTGANVYVSPTPNVADATTYTADWTTPAGTVYAGSADFVTGDIKSAPYYASYNGETLVGPWVSSMDEYNPEGKPTTGAQVVDLGGTMTDYHITGQDIITLVGDNYIWSYSGYVTIIE